MSLRPLARAIGTSPRVLLYLFGSKDALIREVLVLARQIELDAMSHLGASDDPNVELRQLWEWLADEEHRPILRLFLEAYVRSLSHGEPWQDFATISVSEWLDILRPLSSPSTPRRDKDIQATLTLAVIRGLFLDLAATNDVSRVTAAFRQYLDSCLGNS
jgi:AcrR family transcriptional regulator